MKKPRYKIGDRRAVMLDASYSNGMSDWEGIFKTAYGVRYRPQYQIYWRPVCNVGEYEWFNAIELTRDFAEGELVLLEVMDVVKSDRHRFDPKWTVVLWKEVTE